MIVALVIKHFCTDGDVYCYYIYTDYWCCR